MKQQFIKQGVISTHDVEDGKVITTVLVGNSWVSNPTIEAFHAAGWEDYTPEPVEEAEVVPYVPTYAELVEEYIRQNGYPTYGAELAVLNNYAEDSVAYADAYAAYMQVRRDAKAWASSQNYREEEA